MEFLGLPETGRLLESDLEQGLVNPELISRYWHIGLSIAARIVEERGTTFRLVLSVEKTV